jgi:pyocin large subunit-like protein
MKAVFSVIIAAMTLGTLGLAACEKDPASVAARDHNGVAATPASYNNSATKVRAQADNGDEGSTDARDAPVPKAKDGKPVWTANKRHTAEDNAQYAFDRNGEAFGAKDLDDFVAKAHAFVNHPPAGVQKISRSNGDTELYDAKSNTFAVVSKEGAPRTIFKPDNGPDYWAKEQSKGGEFGQKTYDKSSDKPKSRSASRKGRDQDEG